MSIKKTFSLFLLFVFMFYGCTFTTNNFRGETFTKKEIKKSFDSQLKTAWKKRHKFPIWQSTNSKYIRSVRKYQDQYIREFFPKVIHIPIYNYVYYYKKVLSPVSRKKDLYLLGDGTVMLTVETNIYKRGSSYIKFHFTRIPDLKCKTPPMIKSVYQTKLNPACAKEVYYFLKKYKKGYESYVKNQISKSNSNYVKAKKEERARKQAFWTSVNNSVNNSFADARSTLRKTTNYTNKFTNGGKETPVNFNELTDAEKKEYIKNHPTYQNTSPTKTATASNTAKNSSQPKEMEKCVYYKLTVVPMKNGRPTNLGDKYYKMRSMSEGSVFYKNGHRKAILFKKGYGVSKRNNKYFYYIVKHVVIYEKNTANCVPVCTSSYAGQYCRNYDVILKYLKAL